MPFHVSLLLTAVFFFPNLAFCASCCFFFFPHLDGDIFPTFVATPTPPTPALTLLFYTSPPTFYFFSLPCCDILRACCCSNLPGFLTWHFGISRTSYYTPRQFHALFKQHIPYNAFSVSLTFILPSHAL